MRALVTGAAGQDGMILGSMLARAGCEVVAVIKPTSDVTLLRRYMPTATILEVDLADGPGLRAVVSDCAPQQIFNLGGFTSPSASWEHEDEVYEVNVAAVAILLEAQRKLPGTRLFQASSASIFEGVDRSPQTERSERVPRSPYARSKAQSMTLVDAARNRGAFAVCGILYNHESPLRGENFVTRKVSLGVARIAAGLQDRLDLGDVDVARDWGWAPDYVVAMRLMLAADVPHDYVLATGISHRLSFFIDRAFRAAGIEAWSGRVDAHSDRRHQGETNILVGDSTAAYRELGWRHTVDFDAMAAAMVQHDMRQLKEPDVPWTDF